MDLAGDGQWGGRTNHREHACHERLEASLAWCRVTVWIIVPAIESSLKPMRTIGGNGRLRGAKL